MARASKTKQTNHYVQSILVPVGKIVPNTWNSNKQSDFMFEKEKASIRKFGFIDPCTLRTHPTKRGMFEMIDGEHRLRAAIELGYEDIPCIDLGKLPDAEARALSDILNNLGGEDDPLLKADLLKKVIEAGGDLKDLLPYGDDELKALIEVSDVDWSSLSTENPPSDGEPADGTSGWVGVKISLTPQQFKSVSRVLDRAKKLNGSDSDAEALVTICKAFKN